MKNTIVLLFLILSISSRSKAQSISVYTNAKGEKVTRVESSDTKGAILTYEYKGSMFLNDQYKLGRFQIAGGKIIEVPMMYNILDNKVVAKIDDNYSLIDKIDFSIGEQNFILLKNSYYEVLYESTLSKDSVSYQKIKLLKKYFCNFKRKEAVGYATQTDFDGEYIRTELYYFLFPNDELSVVQMTNKSVKKALLKANVLSEKALENMPEIKNSQDLINFLDNLSHKH